MQIWPGRPFPLGATFDGFGTNFSLFSEVAERVELCLFDADGKETRVDLPETTALCWHGYLPDVRPGQAYGYRIHGPWDPEQGLWCNPNKVLIDPYAKAVEGPWQLNEALFPYHFGEPESSRNDLDSGPYIPKCMVIDPFFDWNSDARPNTPWHRTVVYETHVKGFTERHPGIPEELRGTYAGLAHPTAVRYLQRLGITAIELLPVHQFVQDATLQERGLRNYWGYNSIAYLAPHHEYARRSRGNQVQEFKHLVKTMHQAGIEVILDVVYNHTAEGNHLGPILSYKGIDNRAYYRLTTDRRRYYIDYTGTGNTLNMRHPHVLQLIMDSLRYWVLEMHVDGFRFDLAATLARELHDVDRLSSFFDLIQQDPVVSQVKLIAEPWDIGEGGYQVGNFPPLWSEWNGIYRDTIRDFWRSEATVGDFAQRFTGSSDLYAEDGRRPFASINFVTAHDGFTLADLVSYNQKHNEANGEGNRDGTDDNRSWNHGVEGPTDDPEIVALRRRQMRNFLVTLLLSQGVPMILGGDELGRTQRGNNNAWCQDNELSWFRWDEADEELLSFARRVIRLRLDHRVFRRQKFLEGRELMGSGAPDVWWFRSDGRRMTQADWRRGDAHTLGVFLNGREIGTPSPTGEPVSDDSFLMLFNAWDGPIAFTLPPRRFGRRWALALSTWEPEADGDLFPARGLVPVEGRSVVVLRSTQ